jgi:dolichol-phosphate mannosyltransferase
MRPLVIIPTYNEREHVQRLVPRLLEIPELRVLVVDDMSPDGTGFAAEVLAERSEGRVSVMHRLGRPRGVGHAVLDGIRRALETDADVICQIDADPSYQPAQLLSMLDAVQQADLVIGSRYVPGAQIVNAPLHHRFLDAAIDVCLRVFCSIGVRDCTSGFRCWRRAALAALPLHRIDSQGGAGLVHMLHEALANGCRVAEVPITLVGGARRASTARPRFAAEYVALPWKLAFSRATTTAAASAPPAALRAADSGPR